MRRWLANPGVWFWPVAALAVVSLHFWFPESATGTAHDSYSPTAQGQKAFYRLAARHPENYLVSRNRRPLTGLPEMLSHDATLCLLGPERPPTSDEWLALREWVRNGGSLLYAFHGTKEQEIDWLRVKYIPSSNINDDLEPKTPLVKSSQLAWWTDGKLEAPQSSSLVEYDGTLQAARLNYGAGRAVIVAGALPFSNQALTYGDNGVLAMRLLESAGDPSQVVFDESLNSSGTSKIVGILFDPLLRPVTIQVLLVSVLFGWWQSRRFGPLTLSTVVPRQNIVEHTDMVGNLYWKTQDGLAVLKAYLRQLSGKLRLKTFKGNEDRVLEPIARRSGRKVTSIRRDLQQAFAAVRSKRVDRRDAARYIRKLARIRQAADARRESGTGASS